MQNIFFLKILHVYYDFFTCKWPEDNVNRTGIKINHYRINTAWINSSGTTYHSNPHCSPQRPQDHRPFQDSHSILKSIILETKTMNFFRSSKSWNYQDSLKKSILFLRDVDISAGLTAQILPKIKESPILIPICNF